MIRPRVWPDRCNDCYAPDDPYVRRYWTAIVGPSAVADLLRLIAAARKRSELRRPNNLATLAREDLVLLAGTRVWVRLAVPPLGRRQLRRLPPALRAEHEEWVERRDQEATEAAT